MDKLTHASRATLGTLLVLVGFFAGAGTGAFAAIDADSADDVCPVDADPCIIAEKVQIADGAVLDFGARGLQVTGSGQLDFGAGDVTVYCESLHADTTAAALNLRGPVGGGRLEGGAVEIVVMSGCSGNVAVGCVDGFDCRLGNCGVRRCTKGTARTCTDDSTCDLGPCGANHRCQGLFSARCTTDDDCNHGTCSAQTTCQGLAVGRPVSCSVNSDCSLGECPAGDSTFTVEALIDGHAAAAGSLTIRSAGDVALGRVNMASTLDGAGGSIRLESNGDILLAGPVDAYSTGLPSGGWIDVFAAGDVDIREMVNANGGEGGGYVSVDAGGSIGIARSIVANGTIGESYGGGIDLDAGGDVLVTSKSAASKTLLQVNASGAFEGGEAGYVVIDADGDIVLGPDTRIVADGAGPLYGHAGIIEVWAGEDLSLDGEIQAHAEGVSSTAEYAEFGADGNLQVGPEAVFDLSEANEGEGGPSLYLDSGGELVFDGLADLRAGEYGVGYLDLVSGAGLLFRGVADLHGRGGGVVSLISQGDLAFSGSLLIRGTSDFSYGEVEFDACHLVVEQRGRIDRRTAEGSTLLESAESLKLLAGSAILADSGTNTLRYRSALKPPVLLGEVDPAPILDHRPNARGCPVCGNDEIDATETCDDGNSESGDGCSAECQNENCLAQTVAPGYPVVALCNDANGCTTDTCNTAVSGGTCQHLEIDCSDGIECTIDGCASGTCTHVGDDGSCDDGNACTDDVCSSETGCTHAANEASCDDGDACTGGDHCSEGTCVGSPPGACVVCGDGAVTPPEGCDDGEASGSVGGYCGADCTLVPCGQPINPDSVKPLSSDAQFVLRAAVGQASCSTRVCDVDGNGEVRASDALRILRRAVGQEMAFRCPES